MTPSYLPPSGGPDWWVKYREELEEQRKKADMDIFQHFWKLHRGFREQAVISHPTGLEPDLDWWEDVKFEEYLKLKRKAASVT